MLTECVTVCYTQSPFFLPCLSLPLPGRGCKPAKLLLSRRPRVGRLSWSRLGSLRWQAVAFPWRVCGTDRMGFFDLQAPVKPLYGQQLGTMPTNRIGQDGFQWRAGIRLIPGMSAPPELHGGGWRLRVACLRRRLQQSPVDLNPGEVRGLQKMLYTYNY